MHHFGAPSLQETRGYDSFPMPPAPVHVLAGFNARPGTGARGCGTHLDMNPTGSAERRRRVWHGSSLG